RQLALRVRSARWGRPQSALIVSAKPSVQPLALTGVAGRAGNKPQAFTRLGVGGRLWLDLLCSLRFQSRKLGEWQGILGRRNDFQPRQLDLEPSRMEGAGHILHEVLLSLCQGLTCDLLGKFQGDAFVVDGRTDRTLHEISVVAGE